MKAIDDYLFQRAWNDPCRYAHLLSCYQAVMTPDFSMFTDYPVAVQLYNHWRKHLLGAYWQSLGLTVIPSICWSDHDSYTWCFDGEPVGGTVAVSSVGTQKNPLARTLFLDGYSEMMRRLKPENSKFKKGKSKCSTPTLNETDIQNKFLSAYGQLILCRDTILTSCEEAISFLTDTAAIDERIQATNEKLEQNTELIRAVVREHAAIAQTEEEYHHKYDPLMAEHEAISARLDGYLAERARKIERGKQLRSFLAALRKAPDSLLEWDEQVWLLMVDQATVFPNGSVCFTFKDGTEITA